MEATSQQIPTALLVQALNQVPGIQVTTTGQNSITFGAWAFRWLNTYKRGVVKDNTFWGTYYEPVMLHLVPVFGERDLSSISPSEIQEFFKTLRAKLSLETQKKIRNALSQIYEAGIDEGICAYNPVRRSLVLKSDVPPAVKETWTLDQYNTAYQFALSHPDGLAIITLMETAITRSELLGLTWSDLDVGHQVLVLRNGLVDVKNVETERHELVHHGLKNRYRRREIPLSPLLAQLLSLKPRTITVCDPKKHIPRHIVHPEYIFHAPQGGPYDPNNWYRRVLIPFMVALHTAHPEVPMLTTHELRHTRATLLKDQRKDLFSIARLLGHCNLNMLAQRYAHDNVEALRVALGV